MKPLNPDEPRQVGRYRLVAALGEGGMGRVLLGVSPDGRLVAVKQVHPGFAHDYGFRSRFRREVQASRMVSGAYTAAVMDADPDAETPWLASVFVAGPSLKEAIDAAGPLPPRSVRTLAVGLASALGEIHRVGLVHRDLKPSNVLLTDDGPRVIDFGIARAAEGAADITHTGAIIGSPGFMSPEQANGLPVTPASDVFSLGSLLAMAATGHAPFGGTSTPQVLYNVVHGSPDLTSLDPDSRRLIEPCLAKDRRQRPTPAQILDFLGVVSPGAMPWPPSVHALIARQKAAVDQALAVPVPPTGKRRGRKIAVAAATAVVAAGAVTTVVLVNRDSPARPIAQQPSATAPPGDPFSLAALRTVDPCRLLSTDSLPRSGPILQPNPDASELSDCGYYFAENGTGSSGSLSIRLAQPVRGGIGTATKIGRFDAAENPDGNSCTEAVENPSASRFALEFTAIRTAATACAVAREAAEVVLGAVQGNPPRFDATQRTLTGQDWCSASVKQQLASSTGGDFRPETQSLHRCYWGADKNAYSVGVFASSKATRVRADAREIEIDGVKMFEKATDEDCEISWDYVIRPDADARGEQLTVARRGGTAGPGFCDQAREVMKAVKSGLPPSK